MVTYVCTLDRDSLILAACRRVVQAGKPGTRTQLTFLILTLIRPVRFVSSEWSARPLFEKRSREFVDHLREGIAGTGIKGPIRVDRIGIMRHLVRLTMTRQSVG